MSEVLRQLREAAAERARAITAQYPDWPCRKGCALCCRNLAQPMALAEAEWAEVETGLALLSEEVRAAVDHRQAKVTGPPYQCPYLDPLADACLIYAHRPIACRTYGFYIDERGTGLYCGIIRARVEDGEFAEVVWGNHGAADQRLKALGPRRSH